MIKIGRIILAVVAVLAFHFVIGAPVLREVAKYSLDQKTQTVVSRYGDEILAVNLGNQAEAPNCAISSAVEVWLGMTGLDVSKDEFAYADPFEVQQAANYKKSGAAESRQDTIHIPLQYVVCGSENTSN